MLEYQTFCYLQNHKTGCTFVETFVRQFSAEPLQFYGKHLAPRIRKPGKFYFVNVREPLDVYLSLFNFGSDGKGDLRDRIARMGADHLYDPQLRSDSFDRWLTAILDPAFIQGIYPEHAAALRRTGLVSMRFLRLATFDFTFASPAVHRILKFESLRQDLADAVERNLAGAIGEPANALAWIETAPPENRSERRELNQRMTLRRLTVKKLLVREKALYAAFYKTEKQALQRLAVGATGMVRNLPVID